MSLGLPWQLNLVNSHWNSFAEVIPVSTHKISFDAKIKKKKKKFFQVLNFFV